MEIVFCETTKAQGSSSLISSNQEGSGSFLELFSELVKGLLQNMESPLMETRPGVAIGTQEEEVCARVPDELILSQGLIQQQALDWSLETRPQADASSKEQCLKLSDQEHPRPSDEKSSFVALAALWGAKSEKLGVSDCELQSFGGFEVLGSVYACQDQMFSQNLLVHALDARGERSFTGTLEGPNGEEIAWSMKESARAFLKDFAKLSGFPQMFEPKASFEIQLDSLISTGEVKTNTAGKTAQAQPVLLKETFSPGLSSEGLSEPISMSQPLVAQGLKHTWEKVSMAIHEALWEKETPAPGEKVILETQARGLDTSQGPKAGFTGLAEGPQAQDQRWQESSGETKHGPRVVSGGPKTQEQMAGTVYEHEEAIDTAVSGFNRGREGLEQTLSGGQPESRHESFQFLQQTKADSSAGKPFDGSGLSQASLATQYPSEGLSEPISMSQPLVAQGLKHTWEKVSMAIHEALWEKETPAPGEKVILETQARGLDTSQGPKAGFTGLAEGPQAQDQRWQESSGETKHGPRVVSGGPKTQEQMAGTVYEHEEAIDTAVSGFNRGREGLEQTLSGGQPESRHESFQFLQQTKADSSAGKPFDGSGLSQASLATQYPEGTKESFMEPTRSGLSGNVREAGQADTIKAQIHTTNIRDQQVVHMELEPPELGLLRVRIKVHRDGVEALFFTQGPEQKAALEQGLSQLRHSLAEQGFINQHLAVDVGDGRGNWTFHNRMQEAPLLGHQRDHVAEPRQEHTNSSLAQEEPGILHLRV